MGSLIEELAAMPGVLWLRVFRNNERGRWKWFVDVETERSVEMMRRSRRDRGDYAAHGWGTTAIGALEIAKRELLKHTATPASPLPDAGEQSP